MKAYLEKLIDSTGQEQQDTGESEEKSFARLAIYDSMLVSPYIIELSAADLDEFIALLATRSYQASQEKGGAVPFTIIKEIVENLIHACFNEVIITILDNGNTIRISDQGPGIKNKTMVFEPGFTTATRDMKRFIKGVGSGLPVVRESLTFLGGSISIEDNIDRGTVVTLTLPGGVVTSKAAPESSAPVRLGKRQRQVLFLVTELGSVGPSRLATELKISLSTAYRDLGLLEDMGLVKLLAGGKRTLTTAGIEQLDHFVSS